MTEVAKVEFPSVKEPTEDAPVRHDNIYMAVLAATSDMPTIERNGTMTLGSNTISFTKIEDVRRALNPILDRHGLLIFPRFLSEKTDFHQAQEPMSMIALDPDGNIRPRGEIRDGKIPSTRVRVQVVYEFKLVYAPTGDSETASFIGEAMDTNGDKATGKATTAAVKRLLVEVFRVIDPSEKDIEEDNPEDRNRSATTDRRAGGPGSDRGAQQRGRAQPGAAPIRRGAPAPAATPPTRAEVDANPEAHVAQDGTLPDGRPEPEEAPEATRLDLAKKRVVAARGKLGYEPSMIDQIATEVTGKKTRAEWIILPTAVEKLATELERRAAEADRNQPA